MAQPKIIMPPNIIKGSASVGKVLVASMELVDNGVLLAVQYLEPDGHGPFLIREVYDTVDDAIGRIKQLI